MWVLPEMKSTSPRTPRKLFCQPSWSLSQELSHLFLYSCNYFISKSHFIQCMAFRDPHVQDVGSSLKSATWLPLPRARRRPPCDTWHRSFHPDGNSHSLHPDGILVHYTRTEILHGRRSTFSGYFSVGACHRLREQCDSTSPDRHVRILW